MTAPADLRGVGRPTAAAATFPYAHRTVAEIDAARRATLPSSCFRCGARWGRCDHTRED